MALFKRTDLKDKGFNDEQIEFIMTEANRSLAANYAPKSDIQAQIDAAVQAAVAKAEPVDVKSSEEYLKVVSERDMLRAIGGEDFASVKPKFREQVFGMLDRSAEAPSVADQLKTIGEKYEEYFVPETNAQPEAPAAKPSFGGETKGSAPTGKTGPSFNDTWKFPTKKE